MKNNFPIIIPTLFVGKNWVIKKIRRQKISLVKKHPIIKKNIPIIKTKIHHLLPTFFPAKISFQRKMNKQTKIKTNVTTH